MKKGTVSPKKGKSWEEMYGKDRAKEMREELRNAILGKKATLKTRKKMSKAQREYNKSHQKHSRGFQKGNHMNALENHPLWKGGVTITDGGYIMEKCHSHPFARINGYVLQHRLVMERHIGRTLLPTEIVHYINGDTLDNRIENLMLFSSIKEHMAHHRQLKKGEVLVQCD